jgi:hypothetical protein
MADSAKLIPIRKVFEDEDYNLAAENQGYYCQQLQCENMSGAWETLGNYKMVALANGAQTLTAGFWFLAQVMPRPLVIPFSCFPQPPTAPIKFLFMTTNIPKTLKAQIGNRHAPNLKDSKLTRGNA